jgi:Na+/glutamate symporter
MIIVLIISLNWLAFRNFLSLIVHFLTELCLPRPVVFGIGRARAGGKSVKGPEYDGPAPS